MCCDNLLKTLEGAPAEVGGDFDCENNDLTQLDCSTNIKGRLYCNANNINTKSSGFYGHAEGGVIFDLSY